MTSQSNYPPVRTLMGPGPSDVHPRVLQAMARPTVGHLDPAFVGVMDDIQSLLRYTFMTDNEWTLALSGPGSLGMETCLVNLLEPGETIVVCVNGVFGGRMKEIAARTGATCVVVEDDWGAPADPRKLDAALAAHPDATRVAFVHGETSTGVLSDAKALVDVAHRHDCIAIVDTVATLGGVEVDVDGWGADVVYSGSQKCLSCAPGLSPVTIGARAREVIAARRTPVQSWFMDLGLLMTYWGGEAKRSYHHTAPVNALYGLHEALVMHREEGRENAWARHRAHHDALRRGLDALGLELTVPEQWRIPQLNAVAVPDGVEDAAVRRRLLEDYDLEIGAGLGPLAGKIWRIGIMGQSASARNVSYCLSALAEVIR